jgi:hypothetical protein
MDSRLKIFTDRQHCDKLELSALSPILRYHWNGLSKDDRVNGKENAQSPFKIVSHPVEADICVVPREWNHYLWHKKVNEVVALAEQAKQFGKKIIIWFRGDLSPIIPITNAVIFQSAIDRSKTGQNRYVAPYFIEDPRQTPRQGYPLYREKREVPVVGFCGYGHASLIKLAYSMVANLKHNLSVAIGQSKYGPTPIIPATVLRAKSLNRLSRDHRVESRFIVRNKFFAGQNFKKRSSPEASSVVSEYFDNIFNTDYTLCIRGYGNWSIRLYETLACGRIPVFVDTDCTLPFDFKVDWKKYCVWIDKVELPQIAVKVADFHKQLTPEDFFDLQHACRQLWEDRLTISGFMNHLPEHFL